jgi:hypothetical protein
MFGRDATGGYSGVDAPAAIYGARGGGEV